MRPVPYLPADLREPKDVVDAVRARRGGNLLNLDRMLLHSPPLARGWNAFLGEVRTGLEVPARLRELAMCVVAALNGADYEFTHHAPLYLAAGGTPEQLEKIRDPYSASTDDTFDATAQACVRLALAMTRDITVGNEVFAALRDALGSDRQIVELVGVVATYNMVSRFLVALHVGVE